MTRDDQPPLDAANLTDDEAPDDRIVVGRYASHPAAQERSLVALAMGEACWLEPDPEAVRPGGQILLVAPASAAIVREQLARFERESAYWPPRAPVEPTPDNPHRGLFPPLLWGLAIVWVYRMQQIAPGITDWGMLDARAVWHSGELWRPFTALFLHADIGHMVSNLISGWFILRTWFCLEPLWSAWARLLGSSVLANALVAIIALSGGHHSIGASTTVFAGLGLLTGRALRRRGQPGRWRPLLIPAAAGLAILGLYGAGDAQTDVLAHVAGFGCGTAIAALIKRP
ncbi:rhomboid family intramembrane serine protease [Synoicihabitans lomoniglobus]|uniref:Rhomboid family intramembrane serine protease n=1 Tax=Synoicihabitans lomoniglobus TaxID=2909285 RepID=A0AAE9ZX98_9BACT|nr:rhomboid family intramembrane serine protease [Opitutaceae bacterium LMO-M01]WED64600.1 rhomboid family intramembrane serine protease [Opitutaceae bacterium LMO-M01]